MFSKEGGSKVSEKYVAVRLLGGEDITPKVEEFMERYEVQGYPTLLAMTPGGAVITRDFRPLDVAGLLQDMASAAQAETDFQAKKKELGAKDDAPSLHELAALHLDRYELAEAKGIYDRLVVQDPSVETYGMLAQVYGRMHDAAGERKTLETMISKFPDSAERVEWRIRLVTMDLPKSASNQEEFHDLIDKHLAALDALLKQVEAEGGVAAQSEVRFRLGDFANQKKDFETMRRHLVWISEHDGKGRWGSKSRFRLALAAYQQDDLPAAIAYLEKILAENADSPEAEPAKEALAELKADEAKADPEAGGEGKGEGAADGDEKPETPPAEEPGGDGTR